MGGSHSTLATVLDLELFKGDRGIPDAIVPDHRVEDGEELPHASDLGHFCGLSLSPEAVLFQNPADR